MSSSKKSTETRSSVIDPVEAAKSNPGLPASEFASELQEEPGQLAASPAPKPAVSVHAGKVFVVKNTGVITTSWKGQACRLHPGDEVSEDSYGDGAVQRFIDSGVDLQEKK